MSHLNSNNPSFQSTRFEIQRTIMGLQERLLRRKELDLQIQQDLKKQQIMKRSKNQNNQYRDLNKDYQVERQFRERLKNLRTFNPRDAILNSKSNQLQRQAIEMDYLTRLRAIQRQQYYLARQLQVEKQIPLSYEKNIQFNDNFYPFDESGQILAKKYFDGTRALQFNSQLKRSDDKDQIIIKQNIIPPNNKKTLFKQDFNKFHKDQNNNNYSTVKKYEINPNNIADRSGNKNAQFNTQSPIKQIQNSSRLNQTAGKIIKMQRDKQQQTRLKSNKQYNHNLITHIQPNIKQRQRVKSNFLPNSLAIVREHQQFNSNPRQKSTTKNFRRLSSHSKSTKTFHHNSISRLKPKFNQQTADLTNEQKFKLCFQQRISKANQFQDTCQQLNVKDLAEYLWTVYEKQRKLKTQLKQKICNIPIIFKKYDVGQVKY